MKKKKQNQKNDKLPLNIDIDIDFYDEDLAIDPKRRFKNNEKSRTRQRANKRNAKWLLKGVQPASKHLSCDL
jgi:hypothetical protein